MQSLDSTGSRRVQGMHSVLGPEKANREVLRPRFGTTTGLEIVYVEADDTGVQKFTAAA
jgi:hypothetical protein